MNTAGPQIDSLLKIAHSTILQHQKLTVVIQSIWSKKSELNRALSLDLYEFGETKKKEVKDWFLQNPSFIEFVWFIFDKILAHFMNQNQNMKEFSPSVVTKPFLTLNVFLSLKHVESWIFLNRKFKSQVKPLPNISRLFFELLIIRIGLSLDIILGLRHNTGDRVSG